MNGAKSEIQPTPKTGWELANQLTSQIWMSCVAISQEARELAQQNLEPPIGDQPDETLIPFEPYRSLSYKASRLLAETARLNINVQAIALTTRSSQAPIAPVEKQLNLLEKN